jgi:hypothetical protein
MRLLHYWFELCVHDMPYGEPLLVCAAQALKPSWADLFYDAIGREKKA